MFFDVGGSMDDHVRSVEELFSAARSEFKHLEYYYFHNCLYEWVWRDNRRRFDERIPTLDVLRTFPPDYKVVFVGDATMSPYELIQVGGANEHWNDEPGRQVAGSACARPGAARSGSTRSRRTGGPATSRSRSSQRLLEGRMFPLTLAGLDAAIRELR